MFLYATNNKTWFTVPMLITCITTVLLGLVFTSDVSNTPSDVSLYKSLFKQKRAEQLQAVKYILSLNDYEKQFKMINMLLHRMAEVMTSNKLILESSDYIPGVLLPTNESLRNALSQVLENTAFFGDMVLRLPEITQTIFEEDKELRLLIYWSLSFTNSTQLCDNTTQKMLHLVAQELNLVEREPNFRNPYAEVNTVEQPEQPSKKGAKTKEKKKIKRGPRLSGSRHGEL